MLSGSISFMKRNTWSWNKDANHFIIMLSAPRYIIFNQIESDIPDRFKSGASFAEIYDAASTMTPPDLAEDRRTSPSTPATLG